MKQLKDYRKLVGRRIRDKRIDSNFSARELSERMFISKESIYKMETGVNAIDVEKLAAFSKALNTHVSYFLQDFE